MPDNLFVGNYIKGKKIVESNSTETHMNFFFEDGTYETAPIIDGEVRQEFDEGVVSQETDYVDMEGNTIDVPNLPEDVDDEIEIFYGELGFYKTLQPIPYTDQDGNEIGVTEVGSIQEVPVSLGDFWVAEGWAEKTEAPAQALGQKIREGISGLFGAK